MGQACEVVSQAKTGFRIAPAWCDLGRGGQDETALAEEPVRDCQVARSPLPATPQDDIDVEHPGAPAAGAAAAEVLFDALDPRQHIGRFEIRPDDEDVGAFDADANMGEDGDLALLLHDPAHNGERGLEIGVSERDGRTGGVRPDGRDGGHDGLLDVRTIAG